VGRSRYLVANACFVVAREPLFPGLDPAAAIRAGIPAVAYGSSLPVAAGHSRNNLRNEMVAFCMAMQ
jgi:hypothetical protein